MNKSIIGITIDLPRASSYSQYPWYGLKKSYADSVSHFGGIPILLPYDNDNIANYIDMIDGLILTGGDFDIDPSHYGETLKSKKVITNNARTDFEIQILKGVLKLNKPVLGICGGMQLINVIMGGSLIQDIAEELGSSFHEQTMPKHIPSHSIIIEKNTMLHEIIEKDTANVNSTHHQSIKNLGAGVVLSAKASDSIIEAIEVPQYKFCIGVQWHPEHLETTEDKKIFNVFLDATTL